MTRLGDFSPFGRFFEAFGAIFFQKKSPKIWLHFGRFFEKGQNLDFYCYKHFGQQGKIEKIQFLEKFLKKLSRNMGNFGPKNLFGKQNLVTSQGLRQLLEAV